MPTSKPDVKKKSRTIITPEATAIFVFIWEPRESMNEGQPPQYSMSLLFKRSTDISELRKAVFESAVEKFGNSAIVTVDNKKKLSNKLKNPMRDVNEMENPIEGFRGGVFITAKSKSKPGLVDADLQPILEPMDFYPGCICRASVVPFAFDKKGQKGVTFLLNNIQKLKDGTRLDGKKKAEEEFEALEDADPFE